MKRICFLLIIALMVVAIGVDQATAQASASQNPGAARGSQIATEKVRGIFNNHSGAASTDTLYDYAATVVANTKVAPNVVKFLDKVTINTAVKGDTISIVEVTSAGATGRTIATIVTDTTSAWFGMARTYEYGIAIDSAYVTLKRAKAGANVTTVFRKNF